MHTKNKISKEKKSLTHEVQPGFILMHVNKKNNNMQAINPL